MMLIESLCNKMGQWKTPQKPASKTITPSGFYQGIVTEVIATELDPYKIKIDVPRLGHTNAGPYPYVGPPPQIADDVWVS
ncbi:MAG TPA: hypothetical protein DEP04_03485, partial [Dehalococcoidia bacterium]|nr:hypothetical protein [Dehalococcoidia bacterium]